MGLCQVSRIFSTVDGLFTHLLSVFLAENVIIITYKSLLKGWGLRRLISDIGRVLSDKRRVISTKASQTTC